MIGFVVGTVLGGAVGVTTMCLFAASGRESRAEHFDVTDRNAGKRN